MASFKIFDEDGKPYTIDGVESEAEAYNEFRKDRDEKQRRQKQFLSQPRPDLGSPARQAGREAGGGEAGALAVLNGITMGWGDEAVGGAKGLYNKVTGGDFKEGYESGRDYSRGAVEQYKKDHPVLGVVADVSGGLLTAPLAAVNAVGRGGRLVRGAAALGTGALTGGISGAGDAESVEDVMQKAGLGAVLGGGLGGIGSAVGAVGGAAKKQVMSRLTGAGARNAAERQVAESIVRDEATGPQVARRMQKLGDEASIADYGESTRRLLDTVASLPGKTKGRAEQLIAQRQATRPNRLDPIADRMSGGLADDVAFDSLHNLQRQMSAPLYAQVDRIKVPISPQLAELAERPAIKDAIATARTRAANQGRQLEDLADMESGQMPLRFWDDVKKGIDFNINRAKRSEATGANSLAGSDARDYTTNKNALVRELDRLTTDPKTGTSVYRQARDAFGGPEALKNAIEDGRNALKMPARDINEAMHGMSASEKEAFRVGAAHAVRTKVGDGPGQNQFLNMWKDRNMRQELQAIFGDEATGVRYYRQSLADTLREKELRKLEGHVGGGSKTAPREAGFEDLNAGVLKEGMGVASDIASHGIGTGLAKSAINLGGRLSTPEVVRDEIGRILMQRGVTGQRHARAMDAIIRSMQMGNSQAAAIQGVLGGSAINQ